MSDNQWIYNSNVFDNDLSLLKAQNYSHQMAQLGCTGPVGRSRCPLDLGLSGGGLGLWPFAVDLEGSHADFISLGNWSE